MLKKIKTCLLNITFPICINLFKILKFISVFIYPQINVFVLFQNKNIFNFGFCQPIKKEEYSS